MSTLLGYFGMPGPLEMFIIGLVVLLLFGNRLPSVMRSMGRGIVEFKKGVQGIEDQVDDAVKEADEQARKADKESKKEEQPVKD